MDSFLFALISVGNATVAGGIVLAGTAFLALTRNLRAAAILFCAVVAAGGIIGILKALFIGCDLYSINFDIRFPSGHAALSAAVLGTICVLIANRLIGWQRMVVLGAFVAVEATISISLVAMGFHTLFEVVLGLLVGGCAVAGAYVATRTSQSSAMNKGGAGFAVVALLVIVGAAQIPMHDLAGWLGLQLQSKTPVCRLYNPPAAPGSAQRIPARGTAIGNSA